MILILRFIGLLQFKHFIAHIVADLYCLIFNFEFFSTSIFENSLALFICTF